MRLKVTFGLLIVSLLALAAVIQPPDLGAAQPAHLDGLPQSCLGPFRSALVRSGWTSSSIDSDGSIDRHTTPGDFRGASGISELFDLFPGLQGGCQLPIPGTPGTGIGGCIDFDSNTCPSDTDGDSYLDGLEMMLGSDPANASSTPESALLDEQTGSQTCSDHTDNDLDRRTDRGDPGCRLTCDDFGGRKRCSDRDRDGWLAYVEEMYGSDPNDALSTPESLNVPGTCTDGTDNDLDGDVDDDDLACGSEIGDCIDFEVPPTCEPL